MLPNSPDVELVALGKDGLIEGVKRGQLFADMSTISPIVSQKVGKALGAKGVRMLDAPVSGGEKGAIDAALSIMVGGEKADFDAALPVFQAMGKTITHLGPLGAGGFTKLANQIIVAVNLTALGEALTLARKAGLDRALTLKALGGGLAGSKCLEQKTPNYVARRRTSPGSRSTSTSRTSGSSWSRPARSACRCRPPRWCRSCSTPCGSRARAGSTTPA